MKTVEQASKMSPNGVDIQSEVGKIIAQYGNTEMGRYRMQIFAEKLSEISFKKGVEFAQRWIPIEEEEPPLYITVLVKLFNGRYFTAKYIKSSKCREDDVWSDGFSYYPVNDTHWRLITLK